MQYILNEDEFAEFQRLKQADSKASSDSVKLADYLNGLNSLYNSDWKAVSSRIARDVIADVDKLHQQSEQRLLRLWREKDPDFFNRKLAWALLPIDEDNK